MPSYVVKPDRDHDFYVIWSSVIDAPTAFGDRGWIIKHLIRSNSSSEESQAERLDRADRFGSSAKWPTLDDPIYGWGHDRFIYEGRGLLPRGRFTDLCERLAEDERADVSDLLEPFEDDE